MAAETWVFDATRAFPDKVTPDINFTDEAVSQCGVAVIKTLLQENVIYK